MTPQEELASEHEVMLGFLYMCPVGVLRLDADGTIQLINPHAAQLLLPAMQELALTNLFGALAHCAPELRNMTESFTAETGTICENHRIDLCRSGDRRRVLSCSLLKVGSDCIMAMLHDVTRQVEQERLLRQHEAMLDALVAGVNDFALFSLDRHGRIDSWNRSCVRQTGILHEAAVGREVGSFCQDADDRAGPLDGHVQAALREGWSLREGWCLRPDASRFRCQVLVAGVEQEGGGIGGFTVVLRDVTQQRMSVDEVRRLLTTDHLTGAVNRRHFFELAARQGERCVREGLPLAVIMLDVDHFKRVNDTLGHAAGDEVLRRLVACCDALCHEHEVLARLGGEEFAILLPATSLAGAAARAERLRRAVALANLTGMEGLDSTGMAVTISLGCAATSAGTPADMDALLGLADAALYRAKRLGRDRICLAGEAELLTASA